MNQPTNTTQNSLQNSLADILWLFFGFQGRISREPYWLAFALFIILLMLILHPFLTVENPTFIDGEQGTFQANNPLLSFVWMIFVWNQLALAAKRAHDKNLSGHFAFLTLIPLLNFAVIIFFGLIEGNAGPNKYGSSTNSRR